MHFKKVIIEPHYFPCLEYFQVLYYSEKVMLERCENFLKQNYNNRCYILSANGPLALSIPLHKSSKLPYKEIKIDYSQDWISNHWRAITSAYGNSPYFNYYSELIRKLIEEKHTYLLDLNLSIMSNCLEMLGWQINLSCTWEYSKSIQEGITDLRSVIHPKKDSILEFKFPSISYMQVFGREFVKNLSIVDLLFCEGPNAGYKLAGKKD
jgi:hypothetical protein